MKTEKEVKARLQIAKKELLRVNKEFQKYDNIDDYNQIPITEQEIVTLEWVLGV